MKSFPELNICQPAANALIDAIAVMLPEDWTAVRARDMDEALGPRMYAIRDAKETFEHVLSAELNSLDTYLLTQQGIYNTGYLVERAEMALSESTLKYISQEAVKDFKQGGRCLAFELPTASGFHTMRATEAVLRQYHQLVTKLPSGQKSPDMAQCIKS